jgi:16S rRNA (guanine527-N7)-methyltransferase
MGAGAGCPVFPLAIAMPNVQFYAVEPRHMRVNFMQMVKEKLHLDNLTVVGKRFETSGLTDLDFISCRALSTFENDWERAKVGLKKDGTFVTLKSFNNIAHLENDPKVHIQKYELPEEEQVYALVTRGNND